MESSTPKITITHKRIIIVGHYGSGKTEISVNFVRYLKREDSEPISIVDLDLVNPYFRSREARDILQKEGIRVVSPSGEQHFGELPIILPEMVGTIKNPEGYVVLDVGGNDVGATALSTLHETLVEYPYHLWLVLNANRPSTDTVEHSVEMLQQIEKTSRLKVDGIIANTHLLKETTSEIVLGGISLARKVSTQLNLPIAFVAVPHFLLSQLAWDQIQLPYLSLDLTMLRPWERKGEVPCR